LALLATWCGTVVLCVSQTCCEGWRHGDIDTSRAGHASRVAREDAKPQTQQQ
jgi:hypothetical protein